jgi:hypothetical protein
MFVTWKTKNLKSIRPDGFIHACEENNPMETICGESFEPNIRWYIDTNRNKLEKVSCLKCLLLYKIRTDKNFTFWGDNKFFDIRPKDIFNLEINNE